MSFFNFFLILNLPQNKDLHNFLLLKIPICELASLPQPPGVTF